MIEDWIVSLRKARHREIGGVLFGEHVGEADFSLLAATIQTRYGGHASFKRDGGKARRDLKALVNRFGGEPSRFNYLGEWHSHPTALAQPSAVDEITMYRLLRDPDTNVNFLVLLINRLNAEGKLELSARTYLASGQKLPCQLVIEKAEED